MSRRTLCVLCKATLGAESLPFTAGQACTACIEQREPTATSELVGQVRRAFPAARHLTIARAISNVLGTPQERVLAALDLEFLTTIECYWVLRQPHEARVLQTELWRLGVRPIKLRPTRKRPDQPFRRRGICTQCGKDRQIHGWLGTELLCAACWQQHPAALRRCRDCGQLAYLGYAGWCRPCRAHIEIDAWFTAELLAAQPAFAELRTRLHNTDDVTLVRLLNAPTGRRLRQFLTGPYTHASLDLLGVPAETRTIRALLVISGVLPERDEYLHSLEGWVDDRARELAEPAQRRMFLQFARWRSLRTARTAQLASAQAGGRRGELAQVLGLLARMGEEEVTFATLSQGDLDRWHTGRPSSGTMLGPFLRWIRTATGAPALRPPLRNAVAAARAPVLTERERIELIARVLDPVEEIPANDRLAACLLLIYGIRVHRIVGIRESMIDDLGGIVSLQLGREPLILPEPIAGYALEAARLRHRRRFDNDDVDTDRWIYPSPNRPGQTIHASTLANRLKNLGIDPLEARAAAITELAMRLPPPILGRLTGVTARTAARWATSRGTSDAHYAALRQAG